MAGICLCFSYDLLTLNNKGNLKSLTVFVSTLIMLSVGFSWAPFIIEKYTGNSNLISILIAIILFGISSLPFLFVNLLNGVFYRFINKKLSFLFFPLSWFLCERYLPKLIPWFLAAPLWKFNSLVQVANIFGSEFCSFLFLSILSSLIVGVRKFSQKEKFFYYFLYPVFVLTFCFFYSVSSIHGIQAVPDKFEAINIALIQPNLDVERDFTVDKIAGRMKKLRDLSTQARAKNKIDLIIWPENAVPYSYAKNEKKLVRNSQKDPFPGLDVPLIFGAQLDLGKDSNGVYLYQNIALLLSKEGDISQRYAKSILFPFSEEVPMASIFPGLKKVFKPRVNLKKGEKGGLITFKVGARNIKVGLMICFEDIWRGLANNYAKSGASFFITLANDAWFTNTIAVKQHRMLAIWRAIEHRKYLVRATNNGITEVISPSGKSIKQIKPKKAGFLTVPLYVGDM